MQTAKSDRIHRREEAILGGRGDQPNLGEWGTSPPSVQARPHATEVARLAYTVHLFRSSVPSSMIATAPRSSTSRLVSRQAAIDSAGTSYSSVSQYLSHD